METVKQLLAKALTLLSLTVAGGSNNESATIESRPESSDQVETVVGRATWYGTGVYGNKTASGEILKKGTLTAAHGQLPRGTRVKVTREDGIKM